MTPLGWLALAGAVAASAAPAAAPERLGALSGAGRLVRGPVADAGPRVRWRWIVPAVAVGAILAVLVLAGVLLGVAAAAVLTTAVLSVRDRAQRREWALRHAQLLAAVRVLVAELEAGARPAAALAAAAVAGPRHAAALGAASRAAANGDDAAPLLAADADTRPIGQAWLLGEQTGAALAGVLARVATDLEGADEQRRTVAVALSGPRSSARLLTFLPLLGIGLGLAMDARPLAFLTGPTAGRAVGCVGVLLDVAGVLWMRRILRRAERP